MSLQSQNRSDSRSKSRSLLSSPLKWESTLPSAGFQGWPSPSARWRTPNPWFFSSGTKLFGSSAESPRIGFSPTSAPFYPTVPLSTWPLQPRAARNPALFALFWLQLYASSPRTSHADWRSYPPARATASRLSADALRFPSWGSRGTPSAPANHTSPDGTTSPIPTTTSPSHEEALACGHNTS